MAHVSFKKRDLSNFQLISKMNVASSDHCGYWVQFQHALDTHIYESLTRITLPNVLNTKNEYKYTNDDNSASINPTEITKFNHGQKRFE